MAFIREDFLREKSLDRDLKKRFFLRELSKSFEESQQSSRINVFLSHSHKDKDLAEGFQNLLEEHEVSVYIDWQDNTLPISPNKETAEKIKGKIRASDLFILLATNNALISKWCPWEIGVSDGFDSDGESILIVPITDAFEKFSGSEYLQLYHRLEIDIEKLLNVISPISYQKESLKSFLDKKRKK